MDCVKRKRASELGLLTYFPSWVPVEIINCVDDYCSQCLCEICLAMIPKVIGWCLICQYKANNNRLRFMYQTHGTIQTNTCDTLMFSNENDQDIACEILRFNFLYCDLENKTVISLSSEGDDFCEVGTDIRLYYPTLDTLKYIGVIMLIGQPTHHLGVNEDFEGDEHNVWVKEDFEGDEHNVWRHRIESKWKFKFQKVISSPMLLADFPTPYKCNHFNQNYLQKVQDY